MKKIYTLLCLLTIATLIANPISYVGQEIFSGDESFKGDLIATLSDGSGWKVHPKDREKFSQWSFNEMVHIAPRPKDYWFKREHKFYLVNEIRKEEVRVMIVQYPSDPITVIDRDIYITYFSPGQPPLKAYQTNVYLNDGYCYKLFGKHFLEPESPVYLVQNGTFLIYGYARHSNYQWITSKRK